MQNSGAGSHPLSVAICNSSTTAVVVAVIKDAINNVGNGFESTVRMPWRSLWFARRVFDFTHLIEMDKWI